VSPRSEEFLAGARDRLGAARASLEAGYPSAAASAAYYAMLYAARAALSEEETNAKTHRGVWHLIQERLVATGKLDPQFLADARTRQERREAADYDAVLLSAEEAEAAVDAAERFVSAIDGLIHA
jgi:uncharacterized protein (UPF0332 family)